MTTTHHKDRSLIVNHTREVVRHCHDSEVRGFAAAMFDLGESYDVYATDDSTVEYVYERFLENGGYRYIPLYIEPIEEQSNDSI